MVYGVKCRDTVIYGGDACCKKIILSTEYVVIAYLVRNI